MNIDYRGQRETRPTRRTDKGATNDEGNVNEQRGHEPTAGEGNWATPCIKDDGDNTREDGDNKGDAGGDGDEEDEEEDDARGAQGGPHRRRQGGDDDIA
ncbi:hypothetical protein L208DRAFT_1398079 [Tricholoma matsutake]|nr:hypothetical protein L208DRAFT_1398079 [Tricholoma matsutake 945]